MKIKKKKNNRKFKKQGNKQKEKKNQTHNKY